MQYFFILGRNPTLSTAEIISRIDARIKPNFARISEEVLVLEIKEKLDCQKLQEKLGGTIKIGQIITQTDADFTRINADYFLKELPVSGKIYFGFSYYGPTEKNMKYQIKDLALKLKRGLKEKKLSARWVESKEQKLSSVIVQKNKLLTHGAEFCFFLKSRTDADLTQTNADKTRIDADSSQRESAYVGKTLACQEFEDYSKRDFGRPVRKIEEGMMPPKLAKIMINLARVPETGTILDPFCGSGTILQEATLMGYQNIIGCDISSEAVKATKANLNWFIKKFATTEALNYKEAQKEFQRFHNGKAVSEIQRLQENISVFQCNVRNLSQRLSPNSIDAIVTEPYLGPIKILNLKSEILNLINELSELYLNAFQEFKKVLKKDGRVVIIFPLFKLHPNSRELGCSYLNREILNKIKKIGFEIVIPIPENLRKNPVIKLTNRNSIIYSRPDQKVLREIFIFTTTNYK